MRHRALTAGLITAATLMLANPASASAVTYDTRNGDFSPSLVTKPAAAPLVIQTVTPGAGLTFTTSSGSTATTNAAGIAIFTTLREPGTSYWVYGPNGGVFRVTNLGV